MSVLITGVTGFIGSKLAHRLVEQGYDVYGLVRHVSRSTLSTLEPIQDRIRFIEGDLVDYHSVRSSVESSSPNTIFHLGAITPVRYSFENPFPYGSVNFEGTMNLVHAIAESSPRTRLIMASTAEVYGWQPHVPTLENAALKPSSPYAVSKAAADSYVQMASKVFGIKTVALRCNNTYGRLIEKGFFIEYVVSSMLANQTVYVGTPDHIRDYMFVSDHVAAYTCALESDKEGVFNVSPGNPISNMEVARKISKLTGFTGEIVAGAYPPGYPTRPIACDTDYIVLDSSKIRSELKWKPAVSLDEGLTDIAKKRDGFIDE